MSGEPIQGEDHDDTDLEDRNLVHKFLSPGPVSPYAAVIILKHHNVVRLPAYSTTILNMPCISSGKHYFSSER